MTVTAQFQDRKEAGEFLASKLAGHAGAPSLLVLAMPRGGVPVAYEVAKALKAPLDVFLVRNLGAPAYDEISMGIVASGGIRVLNDEVIRNFGISGNVIEATAQEKLRELERREKVYRGNREAPEVAGRTVILVDDGLATGACMRAAARALKTKKPKSIIVAVPLGSADTCHQLQHEADEVICGMTPEPFYTVGAWYSDFMQITDEEISQLLNHAAHERRIDQIRQEQKVRSSNREKIQS